MPEVADDDIKEFETDSESQKLKSYEVFTNKRLL